MNRTFACAFVMALAVAAGGQPSLLFSSYMGGNFSYYKGEFPTAINIDNAEMSPSFDLGVGLEARMNDFLGVSLGVLRERRDGIFDGQFQLGALVIGQGEMSFSYDFVQIPAQVKLSIPLLIPASVYFCAGPELGIGTQSVMHVESSILNATADIDTMSKALDFGISGAAGFELEVGKSLFLDIQVGYYYGFLDLFENTEAPDSDYDLYTRAIRFGLALSAGFGQ